MKYRFEISSDSSTIDVTPFLGKDFSIKWKRENDRRFDYQQEIKEITFIKEWFDHFHNIETSANRCMLQTFNVYELCSSGEFRIYSGTFSMSDGQWDLDKCKVKFKVRVLDDYRCIDDSEDSNLFDLGIDTHTIDLNAIMGYHFIHCFEDSDLSQYECSNLSIDETYYTLIDTVDYSSYSRKLYVRHQLIVNPDFVPVDEWDYFDTFTDGRKSYAKKFIIPDDGWIPAIINQEDSESNSIIHARNVLQLSNGMKLQDVFEALFSLCGVNTIISDFLQWNPENESSINYVTNENNKWLNLFVFQKSDVRRPFADEQASVAKTNPKELLEELCNTLNLGYSISGDTLRIEHVSWFEKDLGLDLITIDKAGLLKGTKKYKYNTSTLVKYEKFSFMESKYLDFIGNDIIYEDTCIENKSDNSTEVSVDSITTDIMHVIDDYHNNENQVSFDGFVLVACNQESKVDYVPTILDTGMTLNNVLSWSYLHDKLWKHNRVLSQGEMNGQLTQFITKIPTIKQDAFSVIMQCNNLRQFKPLDKIKAMLGWGVVESADFYLSTCKMTFNLLLEEIDPQEQELLLGDFDENFDPNFD